MFNKEDFKNKEIPNILFEEGIQKKIELYIEVFGYGNEKDNIFINEKEYWNKFLKFLEIELGNLNETLPREKSLNLLSLVLLQILVNRIIKIYVNINKDLNKDYIFFKDLINILEKNIKKARIKEIIKKCLMSDKELLEHEDMIDLSVSNINIFEFMNNRGIFTDKEEKNNNIDLENIFKQFENKRDVGIEVILPPLEKNKKNISFLKNLKIEDFIENLDIEIIPLKERKVKNKQKKNRKKKNFNH